MDDDYSPTDRSGSVAGQSVRGPTAGGVMRWEFGEPPLAQTEILADLLRRVIGLATALEHEDPAVAELIDHLVITEQQLATRVPALTSPRVGAGVDSEGRVYLDHARHIGAFNPCVPEYAIEVDGHRASGKVNFPLAYEGPPGLVHGGFIAVFFDCVMQHHNCDVGSSGKTTSLALRYLRPTPLGTDLRFSIERATDGKRITSQARLIDGDTVLCEAEMSAIASDPTRLPMVSPRKSPMTTEADDR